LTDDAGAVFAEYVKEQFELEDKRRASLETRGTGVITVSGTLVTLLLGIATLVTRGPQFVPSQELKQRLTWALVALAISSIIAIGTTLPLAIHTVDAARMGTEFRGRWGATADAARKTTTMTQVQDLASLQRVNSIKSLLLLAAVAVQGAGVVLLAWSVTEVLR
jgi:hypothetical protein